MASSEFQPLKGMSDIQAPEVYLWRMMEARAREGPGADPKITRTGLALTLLHGLTPAVHNDIKLVREYQRALQVLGRFGVDEPDCTFVPYWEEQPHSP